MYQGSYSLNVVADVLGGITMCTGTIDLTVNRDGTISLDQSTMACLGGLCQIERRRHGAEFVEGPGVQPDCRRRQPLRSTNKVISIASLSGATFTPPRPLMLSPDAFDPAKAQGINDSYSGQLANPTTGEHATGTINVAVDSTDATSVSWHMISDGWDGASRIKYALIPRLDITWGIKPFGISRIAVTAQVQDLMQVTGGGGGPPPSAQDLVKQRSGPGGALLGTLAGAAGGGGAPNPLLSAITSAGTAIAQNDLRSQAELKLLNETVLGKSL